MDQPDVDDVRRLVVALRSDRDELARMARLSFHHPNGFDRLLITNDPNSAARLRVHVWWSGHSSGAGHIHNHPWTFVSLIIAGRLNIETYHSNLEHAETGPTSRRLFGCPAPVESDTSYRWSYIAKGPVNLVSYGDLSLAAGSRYSLDYRVFHRVMPDPDSATMSAVVHGSTQQLVSNVVVDGSVQLADRTVDKFTSDEFNERLGRVIEMLA